MSMGTRWRRIDAEHWVHVLLRVETTLFSLLAFVAVVGGLVLGIPPILLVFFLMLPVLIGWLTSAWRRERPWAWWVLTTLSVLGLVLNLGDLVTAGPGWGALFWSLLHALYLLLLAHPNCVARIQPAPAEHAPMR